jgi:hypothetical protein
MAAQRDNDTADRCLGITHDCNPLTHPSRKSIMSKTFTSRLVLAVALAAAAVGAQASVLGARDPYSDGARAVQSARDVFSEGARSATAARDPYTEGARSADPYLDGARSVQDQRSPFTDGA